MTWTDEMIAALREAWPDYRMSCAMIASNLSRDFACTATKNSVIGKGQRLGLGDRPRKPQSRKVAQPTKATGSGLGASMARAQRRVSKSALTGLFAGPSLPPKPIKEAPRPPECKPVSIIAISSFQCRAVIGEPAGAETQMCGAETKVGESWCGFHSGIYFTPARPKSAEGAAHIATGVRRAHRPTVEALARDYGEESA